MTFSVRASDLFWRTVDKFEDQPDLLYDIYDTLFNIVEVGIPSWAIPTVLGVNRVPGWAVSLPGDWGSIMCAPRDDPNQIYVPYMLVHDWTM